MRAASDSSNGTISWNESTLFSTMNAVLLEVELLPESLDAALYVGQQMDVYITGATATAGAVYRGVGE